MQARHFPQPSEQRAAARLGCTGRGQGGAEKGEASSLQV